MRAFEVITFKTIVFSTMLIAIIVAVCMKIYDFHFLSVVTIFKMTPLTKTEESVMKFLEIYNIAFLGLAAIYGVYHCSYLYLKRISDRMINQPTVDRGSRDDSPSP